MADSWKRRPFWAGPWGDQRPEWMRSDGRRLPAVGPSGRSPYSSRNMTDGEQALECDSLSRRQSSAGLHGHNLSGRSWPYREARRIIENQCP
jgi:hypothetical protein